MERSDAIECPVTEPDPEEALPRPRSGRRLHPVARLILSTAALHQHRACDPGRSKVPTTDTWNLKETKR